MVSHVTCRSVYESFLAYAPAKFVPAIAVPTLVIHGTEDHLVSEAQREMIVTRLTCENRLLVLEGAGHDIPADPKSGTAFCQIADWFTDRL